MKPLASEGFASANTPGLSCGTRIMDASLASALVDARLACAKHSKSDAQVTRFGPEEELAKV